MMTPREGKRPLTPALMDSLYPTGEVLRREYRDHTVTVFQRVSPDTEVIQSVEVLNDTFSSALKELFEAKASMRELSNVIQTGTGISFQTRKATHSFKVGDRVKWVGDTTHYPKGMGANVLEVFGNGTQLAVEFDFSMRGTKSVVDVKDVAFEGHTPVVGSRVEYRGNEVQGAGLMVPLKYGCCGTVEFLHPNGAYRVRFDKVGVRNLRRNEFYFDGCPPLTPAMMKNTPHVFKAGDAVIWKTTGARGVFLSYQSEDVFQAVVCVDGKGELVLNLSSLLVAPPMAALPSLKTGQRVILLEDCLESKKGDRGTVLEIEAETTRHKIHFKNGQETWVEREKLFIL